jgi:hypothetical protein
MPPARPRSSPIPQRKSTLKTRYFLGLDLLDLGQEGVDLGRLFLRQVEGSSEPEEIQVGNILP